MGIAAFGVIDLEAHLFQFTAETGDLFRLYVGFQNDDHKCCTPFILLRMVRVCLCYAV